MNEKAKDIRRRIHTGVHLREKKSFLIFLKKVVKKHTLMDKWRGSRETIGIKEIKTRVY